MALYEREIFPTKEILQSVLGDTYGIWEEFETHLTQDGFSLTFNWKYHSEIKSWLCTVFHEKRIVFRVSVLRGFFKTLFLFTPKEMESFGALDIHEQIKTKLSHRKHHVSMFMDVSKHEQLADLLKIVKFSLSSTE